MTPFFLLGCFLSTFFLFISPCKARRFSVTGSSNSAARTEELQWTSAYRVETPRECLGAKGSDRKATGWGEQLETWARELNFKGEMRSPAHCPAFASPSKSHFRQTGYCTSPYSKHHKTAPTTVTNYQVAEKSRSFHLQYWQFQKKRPSKQWLAPASLARQPQPNNPSWSGEDEEGQIPPNCQSWQST